MSCFTVECFLEQIKICIAENCSRDSSPRELSCTVYLRRGKILSRPDSSLYRRSRREIKTKQKFLDAHRMPPIFPPSGLRYICSTILTFSSLRSREITINVIGARGNQVVVTGSSSIRPSVVSCTRSERERDHRMVVDGVVTW